MGSILTYWHIQYRQDEKVCTWAPYQYDFTDMILALDFYDRTTKINLVNLLMLRTLKDFPLDRMTPLYLATRFDGWRSI